MAKEEITTIRDFLRNYKKISQKKRVTIILNHGKPEGVYVPYEAWAKESKKNKGRIDINEVKDLFFKGEKDLSEKVDDIYLDI